MALAGHRRVRLLRLHRACAALHLALGTDTAGSGRVPAAFNNLVGIKPTPGLVPTTGVVPACLSVDVVTVIAGSVTGDVNLRRALCQAATEACTRDNLRRSPQRKQDG